jgi:hypothetical protein
MVKRDLAFMGKVQRVFVDAAAISRHSEAIRRNHFNHCAVASVSFMFVCCPFSCSFVFEFASSVFGCCPFAVPCMLVSFSVIVFALYEEVLSVWFRDRFVFYSFLLSLVVCFPSFRGALLLLQMLPVVAAQNATSLSDANVSDSVVALLLKGTVIGIVAILSGIVLFGLSYIGIYVVPYRLKEELIRRRWIPRERVETAPTVPTTRLTRTRSFDLTPIKRRVDLDGGLPPLEPVPLMEVAAQVAAPTSAVKEALRVQDNREEPVLTKEERELKEHENKVRDRLVKLCSKKVGGLINYVEHGRKTGGHERGVYEFLSKILEVVLASTMFHKDEGLPWNRAAIRRTIVVFKRLLAVPLPMYLDEVLDYENLFQPLSHLISKTLKLEKPESWYGVLLGLLQAKSRLDS